ncbi:unnamed protein product [Acanthocheilonema viteae]|uniref:Uncharacterized protein n=1 Tax=Acanthocheilonema viteae TaxID=6277 RepID=A0A498S6X1_ACAVI|nr:unnamed protein product [Acanthocheilonema viteae]
MFQVIITYHSPKEDLNQWTLEDKLVISYQNRRWSKVLEQNRPCLFVKDDTSSKDLPAFSSNLKATFASTNRSGRSAIIQSRNNQFQLSDQQQSRIETNLHKVICNSPASKIPPQTSSSIYGRNIEEMEEKLDQFKSDVLDDIIQCGVYTDSSKARNMPNAYTYFSVIQQCISKNVIENSTLTMANLQQAINELLRDIGVSNIEVNKMIQIANSKPTSEQVPNYKDEEFESDKGESLSVIASVESDSDKLAKEDKSVASNFGSASNRSTDSFTTSSNSSLTDTSN